jgi:calcium-dependent protein kinase
LKGLNSAIVISKTDEKINEKVGTTYYIAPEVLNRDYGKKCDVWSAGIIACILLFNGKPPFNGKNDQEIISNISQGQFSYSKADWEQVPEDAHDFVITLLSHDENSRPSIQVALQHPWLHEKYELSEFFTAAS